MRSKSTLEALCTKKMLRNIFLLWKDPFIFLFYFIYWWHQQTIFRWLLKGETP